MNESEISTLWVMIVFVFGGEGNSVCMYNCVVATCWMYICVCMLVSV